MRHVFYVRIQFENLKVFQKRDLSGLTVSRIILFVQTLLFDNSGLGHASSHGHLMSHCFIHGSQFHTSIVICYGQVLTQSHAVCIPILVSFTLREISIIQTSEGPKVSKMSFTRVSCFVFLHRGVNSILISWVKSVFSVVTTGVFRPHDFFQIFITIVSM